MFDLSLASASVSSAYPEQKRARLGFLDRLANRAAGPLIRSSKAWRTKRTNLAERVAHHGADLQRLDAAQLQKAAEAVRIELRKSGFETEAVARSFALIREVAGRTVGMRHFDCQLIGGWILLNGLIAEMETGEGKTLTATLAAGTAALAGIPVHVITVNDYLTARDAEIMGPLYRALGLSVGVHRAWQRQRRPAGRLRMRRDLLYQQRAHVRLPARSTGARPPRQPRAVADSAPGAKRFTSKQAGFARIVLRDRRRGRQRARR